MFDGCIRAGMMALALSFPFTASAESARPGAATDRPTKQALRELVDRHAEATGLSKQLRGYTLSAEIVQLRRYAEPGENRVKVVCIVSIALKDPDSALVAEVRGMAAAGDGQVRSAVDAASQAAVLRVPSVLARLRGGKVEKVARR